MKSHMEDDILVEVSRDGLEGYLTLIFDEDCEEDEDLNFEYDEVMTSIKDIIKVGLKPDIVKNMLDNMLYNEKICIAEGVFPQNEKDGHIEYYFEQNKKLTPKLKTDGTVDYKDLNLVNNVKKGDKLAKIILPSGGKEGLKVTGESIPYKKGKTPVLKYGKNVKITEDGLHFISTKNGQVKLTNNRLVVLEVLEVPSVDNSTGNIYFNGSVKVKGNVMNDFELEANEDIEILGLVEGADIKSRGNIIVRRGIQGYNSGKVCSNRNIITKFIENCYISCKRDLTAEAIMHSEVSCNGNVNVVGKKGLLVGGICRATREIRAKVIGSRMATSTTLQVGVEPDLKIKYEKLEKEIASIKDNLNKIGKSLSILEAGNMDEKKEQLYKKLKYTKKALENKLKKSNREYIITKSKMNNLFRGCIKVEDTIYPGVQIVIGNSKMFIRDELTNCTFYEDKGKIKIGPY